MNVFDPLRIPLVMVLPEHLSDVGSWHEHIPFAFMLMAVAHPKTLVELGTHKGDSYCAFCQAIQALDIDTRSYAVDTWCGDVQAGVYGDEVLETLRQYHDPRYGAFSSLMRMTFDEAKGHFQDGSIDLLHIDGLHTEDAVRHDFESWLPKLSSRSVVLFHDTQVFRDDFGVWKVWRECADKYPHFEFTHGNGLGVLLVGQEAPAGLVELCASEGERRAAVAALFQALGARIRLMRHENMLRDQVDELWKRTHQAEATALHWEQQASEQKQANSMLTERIAELGKEVKGLKSDLQNVLSSRSWRATKPLRWLVARLRGGK